MRWPLLSDEWFIKVSRETIVKVNKAQKSFLKMIPFQSLLLNSNVKWRIYYSDIWLDWKAQQKNLSTALFSILKTWTWQKLKYNFIEPKNKKK